MTIYKIANIGLRLANVAVRFLLTIYIARYFKLEELGTYGLVVACVAFAIYPLGFEFYTYSTRSLVNVDKSEWGKKLTTQILFHLLLYMLFLPLYFWCVQASSISSFTVYFLILTILEHINQELFRYHIILRSQLTASLNVFFRYAFWACFFVPASLLEESFRNIDMLLLFWVVGQVVALFFSLLNLTFISKIRLRIGFEWYWLRSSFQSIFPLIVATLSLRALGTLDRIFFGYYGEPIQLSAYVFYIGLASLVFTVADAGVFSFRYPELIKALSRSKDEYFRVMKSMFAQIVFCCIATTIIVTVLCSWLIEWIGKPLIAEYYMVFIVLLIAKNVQVLGMVAHYGMYARKLDKKIMYINGFSFFLFLIFVVSFSGFGAVYSIPYGLCVAFSIMFVFKSYYALFEVGGTTKNAYGK